MTSMTPLISNPPAVFEFCRAYLIAISSEGRLLRSGSYVQITCYQSNAFQRGAVTVGAMWTAVNVITTALSLKIKPSIN